MTRSKWESCHWSLTIVPIWNLSEQSTVEFMMPFKTKKINFQLDFSNSFKADKKDCVDGDDDDDIESQHVFLAPSYCLERYRSEGSWVTPFD